VREDNNDKRGAKMHVLRQIRAVLVAALPINNQLNYRIMKEQIMQKIEKVNAGSDINAIDTYTEMIADLKRTNFKKSIVDFFVIGLSLTPSEVEFLRTQA
jgi:hypothetical protein